MKQTRLQQLSSQVLRNKVDQAFSMLGSCRVCARNCDVNRLEGETGFCKVGRLARVASYNLHFGEEEPLVGQGGSGTIFLGGCNLCCVFCQNYEISFKPTGPEVEPDRLARIMLELQNSGAENINFVTPSHVVPQILEALPMALESGLSLPLVYNCGGYESLETLKILEGVIDIYMPDTKFFSPEHAKRFCHARDYPERAREALFAMHRQVGDLVVDQNGVARSGLLVRHLLMPGGIADTRDWMEFIANEISPETYVNIMNQYRPCADAHKYPELTGSVPFQEYEDALRAAEDAGLKRLDQGGYRMAERLLKRIFGE